MEDLTFPYEVKSVDDELAKELMEHYTGEKTGFVRVGPKGYFFPQKYREQASDIYNLTIRNDDIFVVTYPRSGTTWTQELVWLLQNNLDFETAKNITLSTRFPFLEYSILIHPETLRTMQEQNRDSPENQEIIDALNFPSAARFSSTPSPRFMKTHLPLSLLPPSLLDKGKVIYVARDPRDAAVSHYHLCKLFPICGAPDDFKTYWNYFLRGLRKVGGWRQYFDDEMMEQADRWITDNLSNTDLRYPSWDLPNVPAPNIQKLDETPAHIHYIRPLQGREKTGFVRVGPKGYFFPQKYREQASDLYNLTIRNDDIFVVTYPRSGKVIYVARDPRDAAVSHYHLCKLFTICGVPDDFKTFWNYFLRGLHGYSPILEHTKEAWAQRGHPNLLFLFYEELSEDLPSAVRKVAKFLRKTLTEYQVKSLCEHLNFNNFKNNASFDDGALVKLNFVKKGEAPFIRRGKVGGWRQYFDDEMMDQADRWITDNLFNTDLRYPSWDLPNVPSLNIQKLDETPARVKQNHVQVGPSKYYYPDIYRELGPKYYNFAIRPNDVFLISHPRSEKSRIEQIQEEETREHISSIIETVFEDLSLSTSQRFIKTHLPFSLLPPDLPETAKVVYIARDPRDVFVSLHHILIHRFYFDRPDELWNLYRRGLIPWGPIFPHIKEGWAARHHPNVYFIFYEDVVTDLPGSLRRMANFFGKTFTNEQIEKLAEHLRFDNFKDNDSVNQQKTMTELGVCNEQSRFIRKGW
ncbi:unnamed protein product [Leptidea sinapis]|uniref:Sulfotransferase domain-containing protein n=1 Tax=Leptidea sinapis TaxID=189913 RepID=A0A5E4QEE3_9NEOP|nr:unnamed protein product [Leptidea sinapis]